MFNATPGALPKIQRELRGRRMIAIDLENIVGSTVRTAAQAQWAYQQLNRLVDLHGADAHVIVGVGPASVLAAMGWKAPHRLVVRSGGDGADLALLDVLREDVESRFEEVYLISGDHIFADDVSRLGGCGVDVTVVGMPGTVSARLRLAAARTLYLVENDEWKAA